MSSISRPSSPHDRQRGSITVAAAFAVLIGIVMLLSVQVGYLYYMKRELQKAADLAALSAAQVLAAGTDNCASGASPTVVAAKRAAVRNVQGIVDSLEEDDVTVDCKLWDPSRPDASGQYLFDPDPSKGERLNAVWVRIDKRLNSLVPSVLGRLADGTQASVVAVAAASRPAAAFSVGSKLLTTAPTGALLSLLRLVGVDPSLNVLGYEGLANAQITPAGLLDMLGIPVTADLSVGDFNALLAANKVGIGQLLDAMVKLAGRSELLGLNAALVQALQTSLNLDNLWVQLGTEPDGNSRGLFASIAAPVTVQEALGVRLDALSLLTAAVGVATAGNAAVVDVPATSALSALGLNLSVKAAIIEPPSIGIGHARSGENPGARAYTSQIRLNLNIGTSSSGLGGLLGALGTRINLPIFVDVVNAQGELTETMCGEQPRKAAVEVKSAILSACLGNPISMADAFSKADMCATNMQPNTEFVRVLGTTLLQGKVAPLSVLPASVEEVIVTEGGPPVSTTGNPLALGSTLAGLLDELLGNGNLHAGTQTTIKPLTRDDADLLAQQYIDRAGTPLNASKINKIRDWMIQDQLVWDRPGALLGLASTTMPQEWRSKVVLACGPGGYAESCVRNQLVESLTSRIVCGLLNCILDPLVGLLLGGSADNDGLLQAVLKPVITLLKALAPLLDQTGQLLANLLSFLGLNLGPVDVQLHSVDCGQVNLVY